MKFHALYIYLVVPLRQLISVKYGSDLILKKNVRTSRTNNKIHVVPVPFFHLLVSKYEHLRERTYQSLVDINNRYGGLSQTKLPSARNAT